MDIFPAHMSVSHLYVLWGQRKVSDPLKQTVGSCHVGTRNWTLVLWNSSQCSWPQKLPSSPIFFCMCVFLRWGLTMLPYLALNTIVLFMFPKCWNCVWTITTDLMFISMLLRMRILIFDPYCLATTGLCNLFESGLTQWLTSHKQNMADATGIVSHIKF